MPMLSIGELMEVIPRWPVNEYGIKAPAGICGDYDCECADEARRVLTAGEYQLAFGVPKEFGLPEEEKAEFFGGTTVTLTEGDSLAE
jgi:hypothetical protein